MDSTYLASILTVIIVGLVPFIICVFITRWVFSIDKMLKNQQTLIRTLEETVIQNERLIKILENKSKIGVEKNTTNSL